MKSTFALLLKETGSNGGRRTCALELTLPCLVRLSLSACPGDARGVVAGDIEELKLPENEGRRRGQPSAAAQVSAPSEGERLFRSLAENTPDAVVRIDRKLRPLYVNPVVEKVTGTAASAFIGRTNRELGMPKENVSLWGAKLRRVFASGQRRTFELDEDGLVKSILSVARDITEARRSEEAYRTLAALTGYSREELYRLSPGDRAATMHPADRPRMLAAMNDRLGGKKVPAVQEFRYIKKEGQIRRVETCSAITQFNGRPSILVQEITERKVAEQKLKESQSKLRNLATHLLSAREAERKKVAQEIHDELGQVLAAHGDPMQDGGAGDPVTDRREQRHRDLSHRPGGLDQYLASCERFPSFRAAARG